MQVLLPEKQEAQLNELALRTGRGTDDLVQEAIARLLARSELNTRGDIAFENTASPRNRQSCPGQRSRRN